MQPVHAIATILLLMEFLPRVHPQRLIARLMETHASAAVRQVNMLPTRGNALNAQLP